MSGLLVLSLGGLAAPDAALAVATDTGSITITKDANNANVTYQGYKIFDTTVNEDGTVSEVEWPTDAMKSAVEGAIKQVDASYAGTDPQDAALWINQHVTGTTATTIVDASSTANRIAKAVRDLTQTIAVAPGTANTNVTHGYWLFVTSAESTDPDSEGHNKVDAVGTAPIFAVIGSTAVTVSEKTTVPAITKTIVSDATRLEGPVADSQMGQDVAFELRGTVASNIANYDSYYYAFVDTLPTGLTYVNDNSSQDASASTTRVWLVNPAATGEGESANAIETDVTSQFTITPPTEENGYKLTVACNDIKALKTSGEAEAPAATVNASSTFRVEFHAKINEHAVLGGTGNENSAKLVYSNNPRTEHHGDSKPAKARDYTFQLKIHKVDNETKRSLSGAKFTVQATGADDNASKDKYVQQDGSLGDTAYEFTSDANGLITVPRIDAGTYTVTETAAATPPEAGTGATVAYDTIGGPFTVTITPTYGGDDGMTLTALDATVGQNHFVDQGYDADGDGTIVLNGNNDEKLVSAAAGEVRVTVRNRMRMSLPITGQQAMLLAALAGIALITVSVVALNRRRRREDEQA